mmetsp:Transcript_1400/g.3227  ORF Transcript_1400/g.3227 Transcript_1400/m.3227 type:complete len:203 (+) Transcript_1400:1870-2478(+)
MLLKSNGTNSFFAFGDEFAATLVLFGESLTNALLGEEPSSPSGKSRGITILCLFFLRFGLSFTDSSSPSSRHKLICGLFDLASTSHRSSLPGRLEMFDSSSNFCSPSGTNGDGTCERVFLFLRVTKLDFLSLPSISFEMAVCSFPLLSTSMEDIGLNTAEETRRRLRFLELLGVGGSGIDLTSKQPSTLKPSRKWVFCDDLG